MTYLIITSYRFCNVKINEYMCLVSDYTTCIALSRNYCYCVTLLLFPLSSTCYSVITWPLFSNCPLMVVINSCVVKSDVVTNIVQPKVVV